MMKPLVADVIKHPLSYLVGLAALSWMTYIYAYLSIGLSDMSGIMHLWATAVLGLFALRVLKLATSAFKDRKSPS
jgi:hypothetical protein